MIVWIMLYILAFIVGFFVGGLKFKKKETIILQENPHVPDQFWEKNKKLFEEKQEEKNRFINGL